MPRLVVASALSAIRAPAAPITSRAAFSSLASLPRSSVSKVVSARARFNAARLPAAAAAFSTSTPKMAGGVGLGEDNVRPEPDEVVQKIADYVHNYEIKSDVAYKTARLCLLDTLGCGIEALRYPQPNKVIGPVVEGTVVPNGARVIGTNYVLDPIRAAFNNGALIRWLDFNDTWLAAEWGHPSDNFGAILSVADWLSRTNQANGKAPLTVEDVLTAGIKAHEIQGIIALDNSFNRVGLDHVLLVKLASTAVVSKMLGNSRDQTVDAITQALVDGQSLRTYRHAPNAGSRKSWAAGDACSRAVNLALLVQRGEPGIPSILTAKTWGFYDVLFKGKPFQFNQIKEFGSYVMENVLFKLAPAEFHAQSAVLAAKQAYQEMQKSGKTSDDIKSVKLGTQEAAIRIISKAGKLNNYADRDHSLQYMAALPLIYGDCEAHMYTDEFAQDPRIDELRAKMLVEEVPRFTEEYMQSDKRAIGNEITVEFNDGSKIGPISIDYPLGHPRRRNEAIPLIGEKLAKHIKGFFSAENTEKIQSYLKDEKHAELLKTPVPDFVNLWIKQ